MTDITVGGIRAIGPTNEELLRRCADGEDVAWSILVRRYERLVWSVARREGLDFQMAADVTQATFAQLLTKLDSIRDPEHLGQWLATVARRTSWRARSRTKERPSDDLTDDENLHPDFSDSLVGAVRVHEAVRRLGEPCRSLIAGLFFDPTEPDYATIAVRLGRPVGSIGPLRGRCLGQLRRLLEEDTDAR